MRRLDVVYRRGIVRELVFESVIPCSVEELWEFHGSLEALRVLTPPGRELQVVGEDIEVRNGATHKVRVKQFGLWIDWHAEISEVEPPHQFVDTAVKSPFKFWQHRHEFLPHADGALLRDTVRYELPFGVFGRIVDTLVVKRDIEKLFAFRHRTTIATIHE
jgi:ligand-binding SRPBCC domain-containing protein